MFTTTISEVQKFWECPTRWYLAYVHPRRIPKGIPSALTAGSAWHRLMEDILNGMPRDEALVTLSNSMNQAIEEAEAEGWVSKASDLQKELERMFLAGSLWKDWIPCQTLAIEEPLELLIPEGDNKFTIRPDHDLRILGRPDRQIRLFENNKIAHFQHRTRGASKPIGPYLDTFHRNPHEGCYWAMMEEKWGEEPYGTVLSLMRKLSLATIQKSPESALQQHVIPISKKQAYTTVANVVATTNNMRTMGSVRQWDDKFWNNPMLDLGRYDNSVDPYFDFLSTGDWDLLKDDTKFKDTEDRYAEVGA